MNSQARAEQPDAAVRRGTAGHHQRQVLRQSRKVALARIEHRAPHHPIVERDGQHAPQYLRCQHVPAVPVCDVEDQVVQQRGRERHRSEAQQYEIDLHRIHEGIEMRRTVARFVDGADGLFHYRNGEVMRQDQHLQFELVAVGFQLQKLRQHGCGNGAQAGLGIPQLAAEQHVHDGAREHIADAAAQRHDALERARPQHQAGLLTRRQCGHHARDIVGMVLPIGIRRHHAGQVRIFGKGEPDAGLQRRALALIRLVAQQAHAGIRRGVREDIGRCVAAAIVDEHDGRAALFAQGADHVNEGRGGLICGDEDGAATGFHLGRVSLDAVLCCGADFSRRRASARPLPNDETGGLKSAAA